MNATELYLKDGKSAGVFYCEKCRHVAGSQILADQCCKNYLCSRCGNDVGSRSWLICETCRHAADVEKELDRFNRAEKLTAWDGWVFLEGTGHDGFSESLSEFCDYWSDEYGEGAKLPEYVWACKVNHFVRATIDDIIGGMESEAPDDFDFDSLEGLHELESALEKFNQENSDVCSYSPDYSKAILLNKRGSV